LTAGDPRDLIFTFKSIRINKNESVSVS